MGNQKLDIRIMELPGGGFILAEDRSGDDYEPMQAVSSLDELCGALQKRVREWNDETNRTAPAVTGTVISPRRWWRAVK